jgi:hypothetical protein
MRGTGVTGVQRPQGALRFPQRREPTGYRPAELKKERCFAAGGRRVGAFSVDDRLRLGVPTDRDHGCARARRDDRPNGRGRSRPPEGEHSNVAIHRPPAEVLPNQTG